MKSEKPKFIVSAILALSIVCIACACFTGGGLYLYGDQLLAGIRNLSGTTSTDLPATQPPDIPVTGPTQQAVENPELPEWTMIYYSAADDEALEGFMWLDLNELELAGSNPQMNIVVQIDRYAGAFDGDGDWTEAHRYLVTRDSNLDAIASPVLENLGEVDMGDPQTLVDFVAWAVQNYPAQKYALVLSDHGGGWTGGYVDADSQSMMSMPEMISAFEGMRERAGIDKFEVIVFDACFMGQIEVFGSIYPYSNYIVASEEVIPGYGLSHAAWLEQAAQDPGMDGSGLSEAIISTYISDDIFLTANPSVSPEDIAQEESQFTLSAAESAQIPDVIGAMNQFVSSMATLDQATVAEARTYTRHYYPVFTEEFSEPFIDLGNFAEMLASLSGDPDLQQAAVQLRTAISSAVVAEKHGSGMSGSNGIAFHFPESDVYQLTELSGSFSPTYVEATTTYLEQSYWDEFLAFHYAGVAFAPQEGIALAPSRTADVIAPGASELTIGALEVSDTEISGDEVVTVSTTVEGNVAYIHTALYFWDPDTNSYWIGDITYYTAADTITVDGVNVPDYGSSPVQVQYEWSPTLFALTDGEHEAYALFQPLEYLNAEGQTVYGLYGQYTDAFSDTPVEAVLSFDANGNFLDAYAFPDPEGDGASTPVQIVPQTGDQFTDYIQYITYDASDNPTDHYELSENVFTWGEQGFSFYGTYPPDGQYALVVVAYDFDNNYVGNHEFISYQQ
jgi:hypothetical protein